MSVSFEFEYNEDIRAKSGFSSNATTTTQLHYIDSVNETGWGLLYLNTTNQKQKQQTSFSSSSNIKYTTLEEDERKMYIAGYLEGYSLAGRIWQMYQLQANNAWQFDPLGPVPYALYNYMEDNIDWTWGMALLGAPWNGAPAEQQALFQTIRLIIAHVEGQLHGYNANGTFPALDLVQLVMLHAAGDLEDLVPLLTGQVVRERDLDCSMMIRWTGDDLILGHTTWRQYGLMLRTLKNYQLGLSSPQFNSLISLSSSPGFGLESKDDFYVIADPDAQLLVGETTLNVLNKDLYRTLTPFCLLTWVRTVAGALMSKNGDTWTRNFGYHVSSSYNNGFAVLDLKLVDSSSSSSTTTKDISSSSTKDSSSLKPGAFWYVEQMPGVTERMDLTPMLLNNSYAGFYNVAFLPMIRNISGYDQMEQQYGAAFSYWDCDRARIFKEILPLATDWRAVGQKVMRYNNYLTDPIANGNPTATISSRYDLRPQKPDEFGGVDSKSSSLQALRSGFLMTAQSGPTTSGAPPFSWSASIWANKTHFYTGLPDYWNFDWVYL